MGKPDSKHLAAPASGGGGDQFAAAASRGVRVASVIDETLAEGPGKRFAVWVQGCSLRCPGCCNPHFFEASGGAWNSVEALLERMGRARARSCESRDSMRLEGITLLGGEPFEQAAALAELSRGARALGLSAMAFSGYTLEELQSADAPDGSAELLQQLDLLVDGRYQQELPERARRWAGSTNQRFHFLTARYQPGIEEISPGEVARTVELRISPDGRALQSGWPEALQLGRRTRR